ncbi:MAG TPA: hypothetical protein PLL75_06440 [Candidatus Omnitrophota bacterium]|nr:hypothetical protein [Candidatus Omnitrophota bacterium]HPS37347.1 hypothetical protein [Candidatus Omnitrophota bacterium]
MEFKKGSGAFLGKGCLTPFFFVLLLAAFSGCSPVTYPEERCREALQEIALKEYKIPHIDVEFVGTTLGVYLPLNELFALDFKEAIMSGKVTDMESLFQPTEAAIDKVEDVLFSMSRVMLSTDKKIDFYYLQATDVEKSGMELVFTGQIDDVKRVRFWDIPRSEYRKRILHEFRLNRAALWHKPVRHFFRDLNEADAATVGKLYFPKTAKEKWAREFLFADAAGKVLPKGSAEWKVLDLRSIPIQDDDIVVYAKVEVSSRDKKMPAFPPKTMEYLFHISTKGEGEKIRRIIPLIYLDGKGTEAGLSFTKDMVYQSLPSWETEFKVPDITMGEFLSRQLTRRLQETVAQDERIYNTFTNVKPLFRYEKSSEPSFSFNVIAPLRNAKQAGVSNGGIHEDMLYLWELAAREFVDVLRSYSFQDYKSLKFEVSQDGHDRVWVATKEGLDLFRRNRKKLQSVLTY